MWGSVVLVALGAAQDPVRFGIAAVLLSRPRPLHNLLAYWLGGMATGIAASLGVFIVPHDSLRMVLEDVRSTVASYTAGYTEVAIGMLALLTAALIAAGFPARQHAAVPVHAGTPSAPVLQRTTVTAFSRLTARIHHALESGHPWVAFLVGLGSAIPPVEYLAVLTVILSSGAEICTQLSAVVMFMVVVLAVFEVTLVSYLAMPAKTQAAIVQLQNWLRAHRRRILAVSIAMAGIWLVTAGMGSV
jgi:hypothetical protein